MTVNDAILIEITRRCNFACAHCGVDSPRTKIPGEMSTTELRKFSEAFYSIGGRRIYFSGGEPLLRKDLEEIMIHGKKVGIERFGIASNGSLLTQRRMESLYKAGLNALMISLDGIDPRQNARIRGVGEKFFDKIVNAVRIAAKYPVYLSVGVFIHPENIDSLDKFVEFCRAEKIELLRFSGFIPLGRGRKPEVLKSMRFSEEQTIRFLEFISAYDEKKTGVQIAFDHGLGPFHQYFTCLAGAESIYITSSGDLYPCPTLIHPEFKVGNVCENDFKDLEQLLTSPRMNSCKVPAEEITGACTKCEDLLWCKGGCRGSAYAYYEDKCASFPNCLRSTRRNFAAVFPSITPPPNFFE